MKFKEKKTMDEFKKRICTNLTPTANGGESLLWSTTFYDNGDVYATTEIKLCSYCSEATFNIGQGVTPEILRKLADNIEETYKELTKK